VKDRTKPIKAVTTKTVGNQPITNY